MGKKGKRKTDRPQQAAKMYPKRIKSKVFKSGTGQIACAQCMLLAYRKFTGLSKADSILLGRGFNCGMFCGDVCGALSSAVMVAALCGASTDDIVSIHSRFEDQYGTTRCDQLTRNHKMCREYIRFAASMVEEVIDE